MPKSRGAVKKYKTKVVQQKKKKTKGKLMTTLLVRVLRAQRVGAARAARCRTWRQCSVAMQRGTL